MTDDGTDNRLDSLIVAYHEALAAGKRPLVG